MDVQIPLSIALPETAVFDNFIQGENAVAVGLCKQLSRGEGDKQAFLWGDGGVGKTHLLQAVCGEAAKQGLLVSYIPLGDVLEYGPLVLEGLEGRNLVCIDDIQCCAGRREWEEAVFGFVNQCRITQAQLLFSANNPPSQLGVELPDLQSRLGWGAVVQVQELSEEGKLAWLGQRAQAQGLNMPEEVARYLLRHHPRDMHSQNKLLSQLNTASLAAQRRLTVAFVKEALT